MEQMGGENVHWTPSVPTFKSEYIWGGEMLKYHPNNGQISHGIVMRSVCFGRSLFYSDLARLWGICMRPSGVYLGHLSFRSIRPSTIRWRKLGPRSSRSLHSSRSTRDSFDSLKAGFEASEVVKERATGTGGANVEWSVKPWRSQQVRVVLPGLLLSPIHTSPLKRNPMHLLSPLEVRDPLLIGNSRTWFWAPQSTAAHETHK